MTLTITGPLLFFGGPYSNLEALRALRERADELEIPAQNCLCSGDVVAYCADPAPCVDEIIDWGCPVVMGNCEESLGYDNDDCGCGFDEGTSCDLLSKQWFEYARARLSADQKEWMRQLPRTLSLKMGRYSLLAIHGGVKQINRFVFHSRPADIAEELARTKADIVLAGHCGLPFVNRIGSRLWINAGVIGMPANDGTSDVWYTLLSPDDNNSIKIEHHRLAYDHETAAAKMYAAGLAKGYRDALKSGFWPSLDVLPRQEKSETGRKLNMAPIYFSQA